MEDVMSILTDALSAALRVDLEGHLDDYQLGKLGKLELWPDANPAQAACWFLYDSLFKKYNDRDRPSDEACSVALTKWTECNDANASFVFPITDQQDEELIQDVSDEVYKFWFVGDGRTSPLVSTFNQLYERGTLGKGSNRAARGVDFYTKVFDSALSHTKGDLCFIWQRMTASNPTFLLAEEHRSKVYGFREVEGNSLSFVNKNVVTARCIATEPTINMWFQLGMAAHLTERLKSRYDISLDVQPMINGAMARTGSLTGRLATIDMESASDLFSLTMCERVFPRSLFNWLCLLRSPTTRLPDGSVVELHSMSTMGNGFTFPMMTMLFCAAISVVYKRLGIPFVGGASDVRTFSVFGDDIIVVPESVRLLYKLLSLLGFRVNQRKSYVEGPFRESCGQDFFNGHRVRGIYIKRLKTPQDYVVAINGLNRWSATTGILLPNLVGALIVEARRLGPVLFGPADEADDACVHVPLDKARGLQHMSHGLVRYKRWVSSATRLEIDTSKNEIQVIGGHVKRGYNPEGLWLTFLFGALRGGMLTCASRVPKYVLKHRVSASWEFLPVEHRDLGFDWRRWSGVVHSNLP
jgi:hypothetical protein